MAPPMKIAFSILLSFLLSCVAHAAEPTETRGWKSTAGTTLEAKATGIENGTVVFEAAGGRIMKVPLDKLAEADRDLLSAHFAAAAAALAHPLGKIAGPVDAGASAYFVYLPESLKAGRTYPLLFYTSAGGGNAGTLKALVEGAELCGWIIACSVESKNGGGDNFGHSKRCLEHITKSLPVAPGRIYFGGNSGGARQAFYNGSQLGSAGVMALIAGAQPGEMKKGNHYFFISGAYDYNRAGTSFSFDEVRRSAAFRFFPGGHGQSPGWLVTEGLVWLEGQAQRKSGNDAAKPEFEARVLAWLDGLKSKEAHRAAWWCAFFAEGGMLPANRARLASLQSGISTDPQNPAYIAGIADLEELAAKTLSKSPRFSPDCFKFTSPEIQKAADKLLEKHAATPWVKEVLEGIKKMTDKG